MLEYGNSGLYQFNTNNINSATLVGNFSFGTDTIELVGATENSVYTFDRDLNALSEISTIDASIIRTTALDIDITRQPRGFDMGYDGILYGVFGGMNLRGIDPTTGITTSIARLTGAFAVESIAFAADGTLYATGNASNTVGNFLYTIDVSTGVMTLVGNMGLEIDTLTFDQDGMLYGSRSGPTRDSLYSIDTGTAALTNLGNTGVFEIVGLTSIRSVPEPSSILLMAIGLAGLRLTKKVQL